MNCSQAGAPARGAHDGEARRCRRRRRCAPMSRPAAHCRDGARRGSSSSAATSAPTCRAMLRRRRCGRASRMPVSAGGRRLPGDVARGDRAPSPARTAGAGSPPARCRSAARGRARRGDASPWFSARVTRRGRARRRSTTTSRATLADHLVAVVSSDRHTVKPWLSARLDYAAPVLELPERLRARRCAHRFARPPAGGDARLPLRQPRRRRLRAAARAGRDRAAARHGARLQRCPRGRRRHGVARRRRRRRGDAGAVRRAARRRGSACAGALGHLRRSGGHGRVRTMAR